MFLLHMLFAIAVPLGLEGAVFAVKEPGTGSVFVIDMPLELFLRWQALIMILAGLDVAFVWSRVSLLMFSKIAFSAKDLATGSIRAS